MVAPRGDAVSQPAAEGHSHGGCGAVWGQLGCLPSLSPLVRHTEVTTRAGIPWERHVPANSCEPAKARPLQHPTLVRIVVPRSCTWKTQALIYLLLCQGRAVPRL